MAQQINRAGKISTLLAQAIGSGWGPPNDYLDAEAIVRLQGINESFGVKLRAGDRSLTANLSMLALLRDAYVRGYNVHLIGWFEPGKTNGRLARVSLAGPQPAAAEGAGVIASPETTVSPETEAIETLHRDFAEVS